MAHINRRDFLKTTGASIAAAAFSGCLSAADRFGIQNQSRTVRPNLLFVFPDQMRRYAMGFWNQPGFEINTVADPVITPTLNKFARQSCVFTQAVSNVPVCSPFRAMLMTGKYPHSNTVMSNCKFNRKGLELPDEQVCISDILKANDYYCGYIGKWHLDAPNPHNAPGIEGVWDQYTPPGRSRHGFDFWYSYGCFNDHMNPHYWTDGPEKIQLRNKWSVEHETNIAIDFIKSASKKYRSSRKPFALFVSMNPPHQPYDVVPQKWPAKYDHLDIKQLLNRPNVDTSGPGGEAIKKGKEGRPMVQHYFGEVTGIDYHFGRILKALKEQGIEDDTIVIFTSDHGDMMGSQNRMTKSVEFEESLGIPFIMRWPGHIKPHVQDLLLSAPDICPSLLSLMGLASHTPADVEGTDHSPTILGKSSAKPSSALWSRAYEDNDSFDPNRFWVHGTRGVRTNRYTYGVSRNKQGSERYLYDNFNDPYQMNKILAGQGYDKIMDELDAELADRLKQARDPFKPWNA